MSDRVPHTSGSYTIKPGREQAFLAAVEAVAEWTLDNFTAIREITLYRDRTHAGRFVTLFRWDDEESIETWRADPEFGPYMTQVREQCRMVELSSLETERRFSRR
ncbi:MAG TPA: antibiotic biosynthesis monooxygenase [Geobacteraceae bacterium]|nr:antibiotic biosynthesis monooxygenase [Geobacteraceae bacterium]